MRQKLIELFGDKSQDCFCGFCPADQNDENEHRYYQCKGCLRIVPYCFGSGDRWFEYCDNCAVYLERKEEKMTTHNFKKLSDYPGEIAKLEDYYYSAKENVKAIEEKIAYYDAELEIDIVTTPEFRNEAMRKAVRVKNHCESEEYLELQAELKKVLRQAQKTLISLERHKREFSVLKLDKKMEIARSMEVTENG